MGKAEWNAAPDGKYWLDIAVGSLDLVLMLDTGITDNRHWVGCELEAAAYARLKAAGEFRHIAHRTVRDAAGGQTRRECGMIGVQLIDSTTGGRVGPVVDVFVSQGVASVPSRVGVAFFHRLAGCRVIWELDQRTWSIEYP